MGKEKYKIFAKGCRRYFHGSAAPRPGECCKLVDTSFGATGNPRHSARQTVARSAWIKSFIYTIYCEYTEILKSWNVSPLAPFCGSIISLITPGTHRSLRFGVRTSAQWSFTMYNDFNLPWKRFLEIKYGKRLNAMPYPIPQSGWFSGDALVRGISRIFSRKP